MTSRFLDKLLARDPRKIVRFPEVPVDEALVALRRLQNSAEGQPDGIPFSKTEVPVPAAVELAAPAPDVAATTQSSGEMDAVAASLASLATQVWRARTKMLDPTTGEPREEMKRVHRHIESAFDLFDQMGIAMNDWINQPYDAGLPVKVLTFQPTPGLSRDTIVEAVRPTVIWKDRLLQLGEVVVGIPEDSAKQA